MESLVETVRFRTSFGVPMPGGGVDGSGLVDAAREEVGRALGFRRGRVWSVDCEHRDGDFCFLTNNVCSSKLFQIMMILLKGNISSLGWTGRGNGARDLIVSLRDAPAHHLLKRLCNSQDVIGGCRGEGGM